MKKVLLLGAIVCALGMMTACKSGNNEIQNRETWIAKSFETTILPSNPMYSSTDETANTMSFEIEYPHVLMIFAWYDALFEKNIVHINKDKTDSYYVNENGELYECANVSPYIITNDGKKIKNALRKDSNLPHEKEASYDWIILNDNNAELIYNGSDSKVVYKFERDNSNDNK